ncbi:hypothetical protein [Paenibacillus silvae]|nr:hypothetical protein [Paenibacillus silvae]
MPMFGVFYFSITAYKNMTLLPVKNVRAAALSGMISGDLEYKKNLNQRQSDRVKTWSSALNSGFACNFVTTLSMMRF